MKMFNDCSGSCETCYVSFVGGCLAGHGDDDYSPMTKDLAKKALSKGWIKEEYKDGLYTMYPELKQLGVTSI